MSAALHGQFTELEPADWILLIAPLALATVTVHFFNSLSCEPRYLMPLAVPLTVAVTLVIAASGLIRVLGLAALAGCLVVSLATVRTTVDVQHNLVVVPGAPQVKLDLGTAAAAIEREHPTTVWADYWLARPIEYFSADRFVVGEYGGYVGFPDIQTAALADGHPSWLFIDGDPEISAFESECGHRGITYRRSSPIAGLAYFDQLSGKITPADLGLPTQTVRQSA